MRILLLASDFPSPWDHGRGPFNLALARALARKHQLEVVAPVPWPKRFLNSASALASHNGLHIAYPTYFYPPKIARQKYGTFYWMSIRSAAREIVRAHPPDVILSYWAHPDGAAAVLLAKECNAKSAIIVGGSDVLLLPRDPVRRDAVVAALNGADVVITVSKHLREATIKLGIDAHKIHVWSQGVDREIFYPDESSKSSTPTIVWVGRMEQVKGLDVLLDAMAIVRAELPDVKLNLIGEGSERNNVLRRRRELKLEGSVNLVGHVEAAALGAWYRAANVTVLPSRSEGLPNVLRESLGCGTPFVASRVGGVEEIARRGIDLLVEPENPQALAEALIQSLKQKSHSSVLATDLPTWEESASALVRILRTRTRTDGSALEVQESDLAETLQP